MANRGSGLTIPSHFSDGALTALGDALFMSIQNPSTHDPVPASTSRLTMSTALAVAAAASVGAGLVHAAAAGTHNGDPTLAWLFAGTAVAQLAWAILAFTRPTHLLIAAGVVLNLGAFGAWVLSRTVGLAGPLTAVEAVGTQDLLAAVLGAVAGGAALVALTRRSTIARLNLGAAVLAVALVLALAMPAMAAEHTHGASHDHDHGDGSTAHTHEAGTTEHDHAATHADDGHAHGTEAVAEGPIISVDDSRLTDAQRERATDLIDATRAAGKFEHFVNRAYLMDDKELDASAIESIVVQRQADGSKTVMSAMYILSPGSTMDDVPDVAGELSVWHDHQNLCWDPTGTRLAGILVNGQCRPGGELRATAPMLHVWLEDTPCGPFAGIEGHGGSCAHAH